MIKNSHDSNMILFRMCSFTVDSHYWQHLLHEYYLWSVCSREGFDTTIIGNSANEILDMPDVKWINDTKMHSAWFETLHTTHCAKVLTEHCKYFGYRKWGSHLIEEVQHSWFWTQFRLTVGIWPLFRTAFVIGWCLCSHHKSLEKLNSIWKINVLLFLAWHSHSVWRYLYLKLYPLYEGF